MGAVCVVLPCWSGGLAFELLLTSQFCGSSLGVRCAAGMAQPHVSQGARPQPPPLVGAAQNSTGAQHGVELGSHF